MNIITIVTMVLLGVILVTFSVLLPVAIIFNVRAGEKYRKGLAEKVNRLRLGKMLMALGVDINIYLNTERSVEIQQHIDRCAACSNTVECDDRLADQDIAPDNIGFCNNEASLREIAKK
jgi:hypothetical protein